jgi:uncharacterized protein YceK
MENSMMRIVCLSLIVALALGGCVVVAPPGQLKKGAGVKSSAEMKGDGVKVKVKAK